MQALTTKHIPYMSFKQVAQELGCSDQHVRNVVREEGIRIYHFGEKKQLVRVDDIIGIIEQNKKAAQLAKLTAFK